MYASLQPYIPRTTIRLNARLYLSVFFGEKFILPLFVYCISPPPIMLLIKLLILGFWDDTHAEIPAQLQFSMNIRTRDVLDDMEFKIEMC